MNNRILRVSVVLAALSALAITFSACGGGAGLQDVRGTSAITPVVETVGDLTSCIGSGGVPLWARVSLPNTAEIIDFGTKGKLTFSTSSNPTGPWTDVPGGINLSLDDQNPDGVGGPNLDSANEETIYFRAHFIPQGVKVNGEQLTSAFGYGSVTFEICPSDPCDGWNPTISGLTGTATFTAQFAGSYTITFTTGKRFDVGSYTAAGGTVTGSETQNVAVSKTLAAGETWSPTCTAASNGDTKGNTYIFTDVKVIGPDTECHAQFDSL